MGQAIRKTAWAVCLAGWLFTAHYFFTAEADNVMQQSVIASHALAGYVGFYVLARCVEKLTTS